MVNEHNKLIGFLQQNNFKAICSECGEPFLLKDATLLPLDEFTQEAVASFQILYHAFGFKVCCNPWLFNFSNSEY